MHASVNTESVFKVYWFVSTIWCLPKILPTKQYIVQGLALEKVKIQKFKSVKNNFYVFTNKLYTIVNSLRRANSA